MTVNLGIQTKVWAKATLRDPGQYFRPREKHHCTCCGYHGYFPTAKRRGARIAFRCPNCESRPRDRQIFLWLERNAVSFKGASILHFAPEWPLFRRLRGEPGYIGGDIIARRNANAVVDITNITFGDKSFDYVICNHVLEHVPDDAKAMREAFRVMKPGGIGIFTVPMSKSADTWEPPPDMPVAEVEKICGWDHKRLYGRDFALKLEGVGFMVTPFVASDAEQQRYGLLDETVYVVMKPDAAA